MMKKNRITPFAESGIQILFVLLILCGYGIGDSSRAIALDLLIGVNLTNADHMTISEQNRALNDMKAAGVNVIRVVLNGDASIDYIRRIYDLGMEVVLEVPPSNPGTLERPGFNQVGAWPQARLSSVDPLAWRAYFAGFLHKLDDLKIRLVALELGNEINTFGYNGDFTFPGEGRIMGLDDLYADHEGQQVAKGLIQYLRVLAQLKALRDQSTINRNTPILSAGLADTGEERRLNDSEIDSVSINATIQFLRANGLDGLVDAYGIHTYPWDVTHESRLTRLQKYAVSECRSSGSESGKPCWITEWGISNEDLKCPADETKRLEVVRDMLADFKEIAMQGRLKGLMYFSWNTDAWASKVSRWSVFRCGSLTESGSLVLTPM